MLKTPMDVLEKFPVRKSKAQKQEFRAAVKSYAEELGYTVTEEKGAFGARNLILGDPENAKFLVTAHYDTCSRMLVPNFITPCNVPVYLLYQLGIVFGFAIAAIAIGLAAGLLLGSAAVKMVSFNAYCLLALIMILGPANKTNANDNTSGVVTVLEIAKTLPENQRHKVCFVLFDLEEAGIIGSYSYRKKHKRASNDQLVLNLDCVGDGDHMMLFPTKKLRKDRRRLNPMFTCCGQFGNKFVSIRDKGFSVYPSDQNNFPYGVGICALTKGKLGLYMSRIHTPKDTVLEITNVNILRAALVTYITCTE